MEDDRRRGNLRNVLAGSECETHADYRFVNDVSLAPKDHLLVVRSTHGGCSPGFDPSCIAETTKAKSWRLLKAPEGWAEGGRPILEWQDLGLVRLDRRWPGAGSCEAEYTIRPFVPAANAKGTHGDPRSMRRGSMLTSHGASFPAPAQISEGSDGGIPFLAYDDSHGILYASMFSGGVARLPVP